MEPFSSADVQAELRQDKADIIDAAAAFSAPSDPTVRRDRKYCGHLGRWGLHVRCQWLHTWATTLAVLQRPCSG